MNEIIENELKIENMIYEIRGVQVMLDSDLAKLYRVETRVFNQAVKRNIKRFPEEFMFKLTEDEYINFRNSIRISSQNVTRYKRPITSPPCVFTEQGVAMLSGILSSDIAIEMSINIINTFVKMRHYINYNKDVLPRKFLLLEEKVDENTKRIDELFDKFNPKDIIKNSIFFENDIYDAYSLLLDIFSSAKYEIIIIDNYAGKELLDILKKINKDIIIISKNIDDTLKVKYEKQYKNVKFISNNSFHDRFIIIDKNALYTCGASFKDLGKKCFSINKFPDKEYLFRIIELFKN